MKEFTRQNCGLLKIGVAAGSRYFNAKSVWHDFEEAHPGFILSVEEYTYKKSLELFESKELDVLIFSDYAAPAKYQSFPLKTLERMLLLPKDHPLFKKGKAQLSDLCEESLVLSINDFAYEKLCTCLLYTSFLFFLDAPSPVLIQFFYRSPQYIQCLSHRQTA